jgi:archaellum biogenesis ATPase FlaH
MSVPTFAGHPRPDLKPIDGDPGYYEDADGAVYEVDARSTNGKRTTSKLRRLDVAQMVRENPPAVPWVIEGLVVRGALTVLNGREGEGKSLLAMALAAGVALGESQAGMDCRAGKVLIIDTENGQYETHRRVHALGLPGTVEMYEPDDGKRFDLRTDLPDLARLLGEIRPDLLILDSFRTLWGGEENDSGEVAKVLDPLRNLVRKHRVGTILLHHSGKGSGSYRGSSAIGASAELGFTLARDEGDDDRERRSLACWKCRPAPKPAKAWVRLSVERGMVLIDPAEPPEDQPSASAPVTGSLKPRVLAVLTDKATSRADIARAVDRDPKDRSVGRVLVDLEAEGHAVKVGPETRPLWKVAGGKPPSRKTV